jgi:hypothetical protein
MTDLEKLEARIEVVNKTVDAIHAEIEAKNSNEAVQLTDIQTPNQVE